VSGRASKTLEAALRVLDRARDPDLGREPEDAADPSGWMRLPSARSAVASASTRRGSWSGGVAMSASAKTTMSASAASIPARTAEPLPP
jgi:hypothetical protein